MQDIKPKTELGKKLLKIRNDYIAKGGILLDEAGLEKELQERRGGVVRVKAYISKYALDEGIAEVEDFSISDDGTTLTISEDDVTYEFGIGQWHMTREDAVMAANIVRNDLIKVYQMKLDRLQRTVIT